MYHPRQKRSHRKSAARSLSQTRETLIKINREQEITATFPSKHLDWLLFVFYSILWFADFVNDMRVNFIVKGMSFPTENKFFQSATYFLDDPFVQNMCGSIDPGGVFTAKEALELPKACHNAYRGHHAANLTAKKVFDPDSLAIIYKDAHEVEVTMVWTIDHFSSLSRMTFELSQNSAKLQSNWLSSQHYIGGDIPCMEYP
ncbi:hypothetical protein Tco_0769499 [Tanacetum coccineum]|uniref:Uncharacterized protein n=1 Tax=Tanacetum coccineum TaxID=301880 RepID=A0ABQ4Z9L8_9ASTR